jgi:hypothetical protein
VYSLCSNASNTLRLTYLGSVFRNHIGKLNSVGKAAMALIRAQYIILYHYLVSAEVPRTGK